jgi:hypothetical protein
MYKMLLKGVVGPIDPTIGSMSVLLSGDAVTASLPSGTLYPGCFVISLITLLSCLFFYVLKLSWLSFVKNSFYNLLVVIYSSKHHHLFS